MSQLLFSLVISLLLLSAGCSPKPVKQEKTTSPYPSEVKIAKQLMRSGKTGEAARIYQQLAANPSPHQDEYRLQAANALLQQGNHDAASNYINSINPGKLSPRQRNQVNLINTQIALNYGNAERALNYLNSISTHQLTRSEKLSYHQSLAFAYSLTGQPLKSAQQRIKISQLISNPQKLDANYEATLEALSLLPVDTLRAWQTTPPDGMKGWISLALILKLHDQNSEAYKSEIHKWRTLHPNHPANSKLLNSYQKKHRRAFEQPDSIAVMLPETGPYAKAALAVREGISAASLYAEDNTFQPVIRYYDSATTDPATLYRQAVSNGAEMIIGPLSKKNIIRLIETTEFSIPVLALNQVTDQSKDNLYQFGLSPDNDAEQITTLAQNDGHNKVLILIPETELGHRMGKSYAEYWEGDDRIVLKTQTYNPRENDYSKPIKQLLNLDESERRFQRIRKLLPQLNFTPRRRHDVDAIFLVANPGNARLLNPQLQFHRAKNVPVYASAHLYSGHPTPSLDIDLDGITFCDLPWLFEDGYQGGLTQEAMQHSLMQFPSAYLRLVALGIDAYNLIPHLANLDTTPYPGTTGILQLSNSNRIKRTLFCARFSKGNPQSLGLVEAREPLTEPE